MQIQIHGAALVPPTRSAARPEACAAARATLPGAQVYETMKTFWTGLGKIRPNAPWTKTVTLDDATQQHTMPFHPGAARYYREIGLMN